MKNNSYFNNQSRINNILRENEKLKIELNKTLKYSEYLAENLDLTIAYSEYLAENLDRLNTEFLKIDKNSLKIKSIKRNLNEYLNLKKKENQIKIKF